VSNPINPLRKRSARDVEMRLYAEKIEFAGIGELKIAFPPQVAPRDQITEIYPILIRTPLLRLHPMVRGRNHLRIRMKSQGRYEGADQYRFTFDQPPTEELLGILERAGYQVQREPRLSNPASGEDAKLPRNLPIAGTIGWQRACGRSVRRSLAPDVSARHQ
jgi:hypothetical protein